MGLWKALCANLSNAFWWSLASLIGGLMPLWTAMFLRGLHKQPIGISDFATRGDFALYSAAFLAPAIYQVAASVRRETSFLRTGAMTLCSMMLAFSAIVFTSVNPDLVRSRNVDPSQVLGPTNNHFLLTVSWILLIFGFLMAFAVFLNQSYLENPNLTVSENVDIGLLSRQFTLRRPVGVATTDPTAEVPISEHLLETELKDRFEEDTNG